VVLPPNNIISFQIAGSWQQSPYFDDCWGAINGTHIPISIPCSSGEVDNPQAWHNCKSWLSQNVFACVDFNSNF